MSEREQVPAPGTDDWRVQTTPGMQPVRSPWTDGSPGGSVHFPGPPSPSGYGTPSGFARAFARWAGAEPSWPA